MIINKSVPDISIPFLTGGAAALFASICLPPMVTAIKLTTAIIAAPHKGVKAHVSQIIV